MRNLLLFLLSLAILGCAKDNPEKQEITSYIPANTAIAIKTNHPDLFITDLKNNSFLKNNGSHPLITDLISRFSAFENFINEKPAIIAFSGGNDEPGILTYISNGLPYIKCKDSVQDPDFEYTSEEISSHFTNKRTIYNTFIDSILIASESRQILEELLKKESDPKMAFPTDFQKALKAASAKNPTVFINHGSLTADFLRILPSGSASFLNNFSNWTAIDLEVSQNSVKLDGITTASDSLPKFKNLFKDVNPARNEIAKIVSNQSSAFLSYSFQEFEPLQNNLRNSSENDISGSKEQQLLENSNEIGMIYSEAANVFVIRSPLPEALESYSAGRNPVEEYREIAIFNYDGNGTFEKLLQPLLNPKNLKYFLQLDSFLLFSEDLQTLKAITAHYQNNNTFATNDAYISSFENMSTEASILWVSKNDIFKKDFSTQISEEKRSAFAEIQVENYPFTAFQLIYNDNFAHIHGILEKNERKMSAAGIQQSASIALDSEIAIPASFITNHRSKGMDIAVQDEDNQLYFISETGNIYWKKPLEARILGKVQQVDILKNGRIQLAFATPNKLNVIDREGNDVAPFPLEFDDEITQPLAIFDYENNRKYRFVVVQENEVFMYDNKGNRVKGFGFDAAKNRINLPPKHIRIGKKDYIVISEASGNLNILDRRGNTRVTVKEELEPSGNDWFEYNNDFISTNREGNLIRISQNGSVTREKLNLTENHSLDATAKSLVTLSDNLLNIKGKEVELDFGLYTRPQIFYINNKLFFSVTDTQSHRIFLFDSNAELLPGFPVYGNSGIDLNDIDEDNNLEFVVEGEENNLLLYEIKQ
ncbi:hypothetical protein [Salinimicrobium sp. GXAS 041]|uniref:hypothetical protein n=1 Tax=Salinimicrobium sp. GXAS 041 TaxID=3400806 RepID=UPI003C758770